MLKIVIPLVALLLSSCFYSQTQEEKSIPNWILEGPKLVQADAAFEIPIETIGSKIYLKISISDSLYRFVFDTGSPSMIDSSLAEKLRLKVVGENSGVDAHGIEVKSQIVQGDIKIGGVEIQKVPFYVANFSGQLGTKVFVGDGVIGADLLPLGAWQMDLQDSVIRFKNSTENLPNITDADDIKLFDFGYPHIPYFDIELGPKAKSKAMFDTGSPSYLAISNQDYEGVKTSNAVASQKNGYGSAGASLGGVVKDTLQTLVVLNSFALSGLATDTIEAQVRDLSPSLVGQKWLNHYVMTLDIKENKAYLKSFNDLKKITDSFGFTLVFTEPLQVGIVWENSLAYKTGMQAGQKVFKINNENLEYSEEGFKKVIEAMNKQSIQIEWEGGIATLDLNQ